MIEAIAALATQDSWIVPVQDLAIALNTMPAGPRSGFTMLKKAQAPDTEGAGP
ncbi:MAG: hypothetical protein WCC45_04840 [Paeniglutamicibacter sp.]